MLSSSQHPRASQYFPEKLIIALTSPVKKLRVISAGSIVRCIVESRSLLFSLVFGAVTSRPSIYRNSKRGGKNFENRNGRGWIRDKFGRKIVFPACSKFGKRSRRCCFETVANCRASFDTLPVIDGLLNYAAVCDRLPFSSQRSFLEVACTRGSLLPCEITRNHVQNNAIQFNSKRED